MFNLVKINYLNILIKNYKKKLLLNLIKFINYF